MTGRQPPEGAEPERRPRGLTRRRVLVGGAAGVVGLAAVAYGPLPLTDNFEQYVAEKLGTDEQLATELLALVRDHYGEVEYEARAAAFAIATREPPSVLVPDELRVRAIEAFVDPMFPEVPARRAYVEGTPFALRAPCQGLQRT